MTYYEDIYMEIRAESLNTEIFTFHNTFNFLLRAKLSKLISRPRPGVIYSDLNTLFNTVITVIKQLFAKLCRSIEEGEG